jgi:hypothetical protein
MGTTKTNFIRKYVGNNLGKRVGWEKKIGADGAEKNFGVELLRA